MANEKVSQMTSLTWAELAAEDLFLITDLNVRESKKISVGDVLTFIEATGSFNAYHASISDTASYVNANNVSGQVNSASLSQHSLTSSYSIKSLNSDTASLSFTSSYSSFCYISEVNADTASYLLYSGISNGTASYSLTSSITNLALTASNLLFIPGTTKNTASYSLTSSVSINSNFSLSSSYSISSSYSSTSSISILSINSLTASSYNGPRFGPTFITPVTVYNSSLATAFLEFNCTPLVQTGTQAIILEAWVFSATVSTAGFVYIRKDTLSPSYVLLTYLAAGDGDSVGNNGQGSFPVSSNLKFQYSVTQPADSVITIRLIGYY